MAQRSIADLNINLRMSTASFIKELDKSRTLSTAFGVTVGNVMSSIALSAARMAKDVATSIPRAFLAAVDSAEGLNVLAQRTQITTETLSALRHQAQLSDVSFDSLTTSISRFTRNVGEAIGGNKAQAKSMRELGVDLEGVKAGTVSVEGALFDAIDTISKTGNQFEKARIGVAGFGRGFAEVLPLMNQGKAGFSAAAAEAERLGLIISGSTAKAADEFNDNMDRLKLTLTGLASTMAAELLPGLVTVTNALVGFLTEGGKIKSTGQAAAEGIAAMARPLLYTAELAAFATSYFVLLAESIARMRLEAAKGINVVLPKFLEADTDFLENELEIRSKRADAVLAFRKRLQDLQTELATASNLPATAATVGVETGEALADGFAAGIDPLQATWQALQREMQFTGLSAVTNEVTGNMALMSAEMDRVIATTAKWNLLESLQKSNAELDKSIEAWTSLKNVGDELGLIDPALAKVEVRTKDIGEAADKTRDSFQDLAHTLSSGFEDAILSGKGLRDTLSGILEDIGRIILRSTITGPNGILGTLLSGLGGGTGGGAFPHFASGTGALTGAMAMGGPVSAGGSFLVGERGPEIFTPGVSGTITPNAGTVQVTIQQNNTINTGARPEEVVRALELVRQSAVAEAVHVMVQRQLRT